MSRRRIDRLLSLKRIAAFRGEQLGASARQSQARMDAARGQMGTLQNFQQEYAQRETDLHNQVVQMQQLLESRGFQAKLGDAVAEQAQQIKGLRETYRRQMDAWRTQHREEKRLESLVERFEARERTRADLAEAKQLDELAARSFVSK